MNKEKTIKAVFLIALGGLLFSGYLSYLELFVPQGCDIAPVNCGVTEFSIAGLPACVYGFFMYLTIFLLTGINLLDKKRK